MLKLWPFIILECTPLKTVFLHDSFLTAEENMRFDDYLIDQCLLSKNTRYFRLYEWQTTGLTFPKHRPLSKELKFLDHGARTTGGGVVFHGKGDFVFSIVSTLEDDIFPLRFRDKIDWISSFFGQCITENNFKIDREPRKDDVSDSRYCISYSNPYEYFYKGQKILGLAQRKYKNVFCSQGIIYCQSNFDQFSHIPKEYYPFLTEGLQGGLSAQKLIQTALTLGKRCTGS